MRVLCVFGRHQYGDASRGLGTEYAAFVPALESLGHEVLHFESWDMSRWNDLAELNAALIEMVERERPDALLFVPMLYEVWIETLEIIRARGDVAMVCWTTDDSWKYAQSSRFLGPHFHVITTTYSHVVEQYRRDGIDGVFLTQWAASSASLRLPLPANECRYRISFVGAAHGERPARVAALRAQGIDVDCFGYGWPSGAVAADDVPRIMRESRISLNFANSVGDRQIKARTFEVPGAGGFLLTEAAVGLERYFEVGREIDTFDTESELVEKIRRYVDDDAARDAIAIAGYARTAREHTYEARLTAVLDAAVQRRDAERAKPRSATPSFEAALRRYRRGAAIVALLRKSVVALCTLIWRERGSRAARRIVFELSWRVQRDRAYRAAGWPGRLFPKF